MKPYIRAHRVESKLNKVAVDALIKLDIDGCIITQVQVSRDLRNTKIYYIAQNKDNSSTVAARLNAAKGSIVREMVKNFHGRAFPKISFIYDEGSETTARIHALLDAIPDIQ